MNMSHIGMQFFSSYLDFSCSAAHKKTSSENNQRLLDQCYTTHIYGGAEADWTPANTSALASVMQCSMPLVSINAYRTFGKHTALRLSTLFL